MSASGPDTPTGTPRDRPVLTPWQAVAGFGVVSLAADMVYEGARAVTGPLLGQLGATALLVGVVTGAGEAAALVLRLVFGAAADRTGRYWGLTFVGYAMTAVAVPLLALSPFVGAAGLALACVLVLVERAGKAVRSPAKTTLLSYAAEGVGLGRGFGVHKGLDQIGAFAGPLLVAGIAALTGALWPGLAALAVPGAASLVLLLWLRRRVGHPSAPAEARAGGTLAARLPREFWMFAASSAAATAGLVTFGIISFHLSREQLVPDAAIPVVYAGAMAVEAAAALVVGVLFDRVGVRVLFVLPLLVAAVPALAFGAGLPLVLTGISLWAAANGLQDSTVKALVADLVPSGRRATAYGLFAAVQGGAALLGGTLAGALYERSLPLLVAVVGVVQLVALVLYAVTLRPHRPRHARVGG